MRGVAPDARPKKDVKDLSSASYETILQLLGEGLEDVESLRAIPHLLTAHICVQSRASRTAHSTLSPVPPLHLFAAALLLGSAALSMHTLEQERRGWPESASSSSSSRSPQQHHQTVTTGRLCQKSSCCMSCRDARPVQIGSGGPPDVSAARRPPKNISTLSEPSVCPPR